jgi:hypothetical protein
MASRGKTFGLFALAAIVGGIALWAKAGRKSLRGAKQSMSTARQSLLAAQQSLPKLRNAIIGNSRGAVAAIFGPPHATVASTAHLPAKEYWHADTWYYPLDVQRRTAVAIRFSNNLAEHVDFIAGPGQAESHNRKSA